MSLISLSCKKLYTNDFFFLNNQTLTLTVHTWNLTFPFFQLTVIVETLSSNSLRTCKNVKSILVAIATTLLIMVLFRSVSQCKSYKMPTSVAGLGVNEIFFRFFFLCYNNGQSSSEQISTREKSQDMGQSISILMQTN